MDNVGNAVTSLNVEGFVGSQAGAERLRRPNEPIGRDEFRQADSWRDFPLSRYEATDPGSKPQKYPSGLRNKFSRWKKLAAQHQRRMEATPAGAGSATGVTGPERGSGSSSSSSSSSSSGGGQKNPDNPFGVVGGLANSLASLGGRSNEHYSDENEENAKAVTDALSDFSDPDDLLEQERVPSAERQRQAREEARETDPRFQQGTGGDGVDWAAMADETERGVSDDVPEAQRLATLSKVDGDSAQEVLRHMKSTEAVKDLIEQAHGDDRDIPESIKFLSSDSGFNVPGIEREADPENRPADETTLVDDENVDPDARDDAGGGGGYGDWFG
jgi:hypothetical protein